MLDHMVVLILVFKGTFILFSIMAIPINIPTNSGGVFPFPTSSPAFVICRLFNDGHSDQYEVVFRCGFDLHFSNNDVEHLVMCKARDI